MPWHLIVLLTNHLGYWTYNNAPTWKRIFKINRSILNSPPNDSIKQECGIYPNYIFPKSTTHGSQTTKFMNSNLENVNFGRSTKITLYTSTFWGLHSHLCVSEGWQPTFQWRRRRQQSKLFYQGQSFSQLTSTPWLNRRREVQRVTPSTSYLRPLPNAVRMKLGVRAAFVIGEISWSPGVSCLLRKTRSDPI